MKGPGRQTYNMSTEDFFKTTSKESDAAVKAGYVVSEKNRSCSVCSELILTKIEKIGSVVIFLEYLKLFFRGILDSLTQTLLYIIIFEGKNNFRSLPKCKIIVLFFWSGD